MSTQPSGTGTDLVVAGEALVDLIADPDDPRTLHAVPGGAPFNGAVAAARLGLGSALLTRLSSDAFGDVLRRRLTDEGVSEALVADGDEPTSLAVAHVDEEGRASYSFYFDGTTGRSLLAEDLPMLPSRAALAVTFGAIGVTDDRTGQALCVLARRESGKRLVTVDPNVRPSAVGDDRLGFRRALDELVAVVDVVKTSDEDLELLGVDPFEHAEGWVSSDGPALAVMTRGPDGATALHVTAGRVDVPGVAVEVQDTVGAGDTFGAGLQVWFAEHGVRDREGVASLDAEALRDALAFSVRAGALACTRRGADPPTREELDAFDG